MIFHRDESKLIHSNPEINPIKNCNHLTALVYIYLYIGPLKSSHMEPRSCLNKQNGAGTQAVKIPPAELSHRKQMSCGCQCSAPCTERNMLLRPRRCDLLTLVQITQGVLRLASPTRHTPCSDRGAQSHSSANGRY